MIAGVEFVENYWGLTDDKDLILKAMDPIFVESIEELGAELSKKYCLTPEFPQLSRVQKYKTSIYVPGKGRVPDLVKDKSIDSTYFVITDQETFLLSNGTFARDFEDLKLAAKKYGHVKLKIFNHEVSRLLRSKEVVPTLGHSRYMLFPEGYVLNYSWSQSNFKYDPKHYKRLYNARKRSSGKRSSTQTRSYNYYPPAVEVKRFLNRLTTRLFNEPEIHNTFCTSFNVGYREGKTKAGTLRKLFYLLDFCEKFFTTPIWRDTLRYKEWLRKNLKYVHNKKKVDLSTQEGKFMEWLYQEEKTLRRGRVKKPPWRDTK